MHRAFAVLAAALALAGCASIGEDVGFASAAATHRGRALAQEKCARCHTIAGRAASPNPRATTFARIGKLYSRNGLEWELEAINDVGHYQMPTTPLSRAEMKSLVAYVYRNRTDS